MRRFRENLKKAYNESKRSSIVVYFVLRFLVILTMIRQFFLQNYTDVALCLLTLILLILPFFIQKKFKITLPNLLEIIILCFIFSAEILFEDLSRDMDIMDRRGGFYEVVPKGFSKATAIDYILKYFDLKKEDAYVFGDSSNDLSMFEAVPHAVAMGAHDPVLDPYTEFVTKTVEEDGLEYAMQHYGLI